MSSLSEIRDAIKSTIESNVSGLICYDTAPDVTQVPSVVVVPRSANYKQGMAGGNCVEWKFDLFVLAPRHDAATGQDALDALVDGEGSRSIRQVIKGNDNLGLADVDAIVESMFDYGGEYRAAQVQHIGAQLSLRVLVTV